MPQHGRVKTHAHDVPNHRPTPIDCYTIQDICRRRLRLRRLLRLRRERRHRRDERGERDDCESLHFSAYTPPRTSRKPPDASETISCANFKITTSDSGISTMYRIRRPTSFPIRNG